MKILIDGMNLALEQGTGVATYARNLARCARRLGHRVAVLYGHDILGDVDPALLEATFFDSRQAVRRSMLRVARDLAASLRPLRPVEIPDTGQVLRREIADSLPEADAFLNERNLFLKAHAKFDAGLGFLEIAPPADVDVAHWTYPMPIRARGVPNVYTAHDLVPLKLPYTTLDRKPRYWALMKEIARSAAAIATVSETSRRDLIEMLGAPEDRVINTYQSSAIPEALLAGGDDDLARELEGIAAFGDGAAFTLHGYFLFFGAIEPKKNVRRLVEAYLAAGVDAPLAIVGKRAWKHEEVMAMIARAPRIVYLDYLPRRQLVVLIRGARALLFPSLYEGFGLPVLEAFRCGTPAITSAVGATAEIAGDAAVLVDPYDVGAIRDAIRALAGPDWPERRAHWAAKGQARAEAFSETEISARIAALYEAVAPGR